MSPNKPLVYIAGPITNGGQSPFSGAIERFEAAKLEVAQLGYTPISPLDVMSGKIAQSVDEWRECMKADIAALLNCYGIYLLRGWENSRGARLEKLIADGLDMMVLFQDKTDRLAAGFSAGPRTFERLHKNEEE